MIVERQVVFLDPVYFYIHNIISQKYEQFR